MRGAVAVGVLALAAAAAGCGGGEPSGAPLPATRATMRLTSPAFRDTATLPRRFTCDGADVSPPLRFSAPPHGTRELVVVVEDVDAGRFLHWTLLGLRPNTGGLRAGTVPDGTVQTKNGFGRHGYGGPCPPKGDDPHRYVFSLYALDAPLGLDAGASPADVGRAIAAHDLARGTLTATYARS
jgi:Raf kinase inhibitor-like YbhB/YbcL family protein